ncbi:hypothetical protein [Hydrogenimonas thermophila]|uniref:Uncharacterized protein n=1 Tax=Hydrogenimonas thermophila TaxID=223786 RepID=A0A1I5LHY9_9BACT|nr:hypothetical protein [Hydrogenimonas thermophila]SFO96782.1 hypothetical protein SAMN05216234_10335 [Hydrogenimonas thermophila]
MKTVLGFELTDEQFEELAEYINLDELKRQIKEDFKYPEDYINTIFFEDFYIEDFGEVNNTVNKILINIYKIIRKYYNIEKDTFINKIIEWNCDYISDKVKNDFFDYLADYVQNEPEILRKIVGSYVIGFEIKELDNKIIFECYESDGDIDGDMIVITIEKELDEIIKIIKDDVIETVYRVLSEYLKDYKDAGTHDNLSLDQKKDGL